jgi:hypothetical protein
VTLVDTQPVRGSMQHFYCSAIDAPWARQVLGISEAEDEEQGEKPDDSDA